MPMFLFKTEPTEYSFADLHAEKHTTWTGVSNNAALAALRACRKGDQVLIYHTGDQRSIVGLAKVTSAPKQDPDRPGLTADGEPKFAVVDIAPVKPARTLVALATIKADKRFAKFALVTQSRLSVMLVPPELDAALRELAGL